MSSIQNRISPKCRQNHQKKTNNHKYQYHETMKATEKWQQQTKKHEYAQSLCHQFQITIKSKETNMKKNAQRYYSCHKLAE